MQAIEDYRKKVNKFILSETQAKWEICWVLFSLIYYHKLVFLLGKGFGLTNPFSGRKIFRTL